MKRVMLSAISSGSGKTTITCGLLKALKDKGLSVRAYKSGPDYIDPMFHKKVLQIPSENLDLFFSDAKYLQGILGQNEDADIAVVEGAMGIYDGILGQGKTGSAYDLSVQTGTPVVLIVDASGMGNTILAVLKGIKAEDEKGLIRGVIFNRISEHFYKMLCPMVEETGMKVLGYVGKLKGVSLDSRHLGLKLPWEVEALEQQIEQIGKEITRTVALEKLLAIAEAGENTRNEKKIEEKTPQEEHPRLAVAMDEAFCFYYEDNFRKLKENGAELVFFSPLHDEKLPENIAGILLGGGYPELVLQELENNKAMRQSIRAAIEQGIPSLAECGGFMYLHDTIEAEGRQYEMVGAVKGNCYNTGRLCRFGYVDLSFAEYQMKGHEFHYFDSSNNGSAGVETKPGSGKNWEFGHYASGKLWGFPHLYYGSCPQFIRDFVDAMRKYQERNLHGE